MTLTEFLLARIAEDEALASRPKQDWTELGLDTTFDDYGDLFIAISPARVLAECEAKRRIVDLHQIDGSLRGPITDNKFYVCGCGPDSWPMVEVNGRWESAPEPESGGDFYPCPTLLALAMPYADHPDFRDEWRP